MHYHAISFITFDIVLQHPDKDWNWQGLSYNESDWILSKKWKIKQLTTRQAKTVWTLKMQPNIYVVDHINYKYAFGLPIDKAIDWYPAQLFWLCLEYPEKHRFTKIVCSLPTELQFLICALVYNQEKISDKTLNLTGFH